jgi:hypothetical protein
MPDAHIYLAIDGERTDKAFRTDKADGSVRVLFACGRYREGSDIPGLEMTGVLIEKSISAYILIQIQGRSLRMDHAEKEGWCLLVSPCEEGETEQDVLDRIALDILSFLGENCPLVKRDIERYVHTYFGDVIIDGTVCSKEETIDRIQSAYTRREYINSELSMSEMLSLITQGLNPLEHTLVSLKKTVYDLSGKQLPDNPRAKWGRSVYDVMDMYMAGSASVIRKWGRNPNKLYTILQDNSIWNVMVFERKWKEIHEADSSIPGLPTELFDISFWDNYNPER